MLESPPDAAPSSDSFPRLRVAKNDTPLIHEEEKVSSGRRPAAEASVRNTDKPASSRNITKNSRPGRRVKKDSDLISPSTEVDLIKAAAETKSDRRLRAARSLSPMADRASKSDRHLLDGSLSGSPNSDLRLGAAISLSPRRDKASKSDRHLVGGSPSGSPNSERRLRAPRRDNVSRSDRHLLGGSPSGSPNSDRRPRTARSLSPRSDNASRSDRHLVGRSPPGSSPLTTTRKPSSQRLPPTAHSHSSAASDSPERLARGDRDKASLVLKSSSDPRLRAARSASPTAGGFRPDSGRSLTKDGGARLKDKARSRPKGGVMNEEMSRSWSRSGAVQQRRQRAAVGMRRTASADDVDYVPPSARRARARDNRLNAGTDRDFNRSHTSTATKEGSSVMDVSIDDFRTSSTLNEPLIIDDEESGDENGNNFKRTKNRKKTPKKRMDGQGILMKQLERSLMLQDQMVDNLDEGTDVETEDERKTKARSRSPIRTTIDASGATVKSYMNFQPGFLTAPRIVAPKLVTGTAAAANQASTRIAASAFQTATKASEAASATATSAANVLTGAASRAAASARYFVERDMPSQNGPTHRTNTRKTSTFGGQKPIMGPMGPSEDDDSVF